MDVNDVFQYPCASSKVGIMKLGRISTNEETISLKILLKNVFCLKAMIIHLP